jgi:peptide/nickel transport system permease protein
MVTFIAIVIFVFVASIILPFDKTYIDSTQLNIPPSRNFLSVPPALANNAKAISLGSTFGAGIDRNGNIQQWGTYHAQSSTIPTNAPPRDAGPFRLIASGLNHVSAVAEDGMVYSWGNHIFPQITDVPSNLQGKNVVEIEAGWQSTVALDDEGYLHFWGNASMFNFGPQREHQGRFTTFALNVVTAIAILDDGTIVCVSRAEHGFHNVPDEIHGRAVDVAMTDQVAAALLDDGTVVTWGGRRLLPEFHVPEHIQGRVTKLLGGRTHFTALLDDGTVYSWGGNMFFQINNPSSDGFVDIAVNYYQNAAIDADGNVTTWGHRGYLMGTDHLGRDLYTRLIYGGRISLTVGFIAVIISSVLGIIVGGISGYFGGKVDMFLQRFGEVVQGIPLIPLLLLLGGILATRVGQTERIIFVMVLIGILSWPGLARLVRGQILSEKNQEFVTAAKAMGIREGKIIFRHIMPNVMPVILVSITLSMAGAMLTESVLSFLGFGVAEPDASWGNMLNAVNDATVISRYWWRWVFPAAALGITVISINTMGDGLRDAVDPKQNDR